MTTLIVLARFFHPRQLEALSRLSSGGPNRTVLFNDLHHISRRSSCVQSSGRRSARQRTIQRWSKRALYYGSSSVRLFLPSILLPYRRLRYSFWPRQTCTKRARIVTRRTSGHIGARGPSDGIPALPPIFPRMGVVGKSRCVPSARG